MNRTDLRLLCGALAAALLLWGVGALLPRRAGRTVVVSADGVETRYSLQTDRTVPLSGNRLVIQNGRAFMEWADCPDQICVAHAPIDAAGQSIVCLPHRVIVRIE